MIEAPEEAPEEYLGPESTAQSSNNNYTDYQDDNWQDLDEEEAENQTDHGTANQADERVSSQAETNIFSQANHEASEYNVHRTSHEPDLNASSHGDVAGHRAADQVDQRMSEQTDSKSSLQADHVESEQIDSQMLILPEQRISGHNEQRLSSQARGIVSEQIDHRMSSQAERRTSGYIDRRMSSQAERRVSGQTDLRMSSQAERRASGKIAHRMSIQAERRVPVSSERRASEQTDYRISGQADQSTSEMIDSRLSGLVERKTYERTNHRLSDQVTYKTVVKTHHEVYNEATELAELQAADQTDISAHHLTVDKPDYSESDHLISKEDVNTEANQFDYGERGQYDDRVFTSKDRNTDYKSEVSQIDLNNSKVSIITDTESTTFLQAMDSYHNRFMCHFQAKDHGLSPRFPSISTKFDYISSQEKTQVIETKPDISEHQEEKSSPAQEETYEGRFPSIVYQDPYQISLQYMEQHNILQIFQQITENLVYERPEDPLSFMLCQVQEMIKNRDKRTT